MRRDKAAAGESALLLRRTQRQAGEWCHEVAISGNRFVCRVEADQRKDRVAPNSGPPQPCARALTAARARVLLSEPS